MIKNMKKGNIKASSKMRTVHCNGRLREGCLPRGCLPRGCLSKGGVCPGAVSAHGGGGCAQGGVHLPLPWTE